LLSLRQFDRGEPFVRKSGDKILIIEIGSETAEGEEIGPRGWGLRGARVDCFKQVVVDDMELRADVVGAQVPNESDCAGMKRGRTHVLPLSRPRLPLGYLASVLEPRLQDVDGAAPRMRIHKGTEGGLRASPNLVRSETRVLAWDLIVEMDSVAQGKWPEVAFVVFRPAQGSIYHHGSCRPNAVLDCVFGDAIMVVSAHATVFDTLPFGGELVGKLLGGIDAIVSTVSAHLHACCGSFSFKTEFGLDRFGPGESDLMNHSELGTGCVAEDGASTEFLGGETVATGGELTTQEG
jgi:hypothetical protein